MSDLPGCFSDGDTLEEALTASQEAILSHIEVLLMDGEAVPIKRPIEEHQSNEDFAGGIWALGDADVSKLSGKSVRVNITLPERVLAIVDEAAKREGETRSGLLARAAMKYVGEVGGDDHKEELMEALDRTRAGHVPDRIAPPRRR